VGWIGSISETLLLFEEHPAIRRKMTKSDLKIQSFKGSLGLIKVPTHPRKKPYLAPYFFEA
jgi:hypothetical protein